MSKSLSLLFLIATFSAFSQERATLDRLQRDKEICKEYAEKSIQEISGGVLLVRLNFRQKQIDHLTNLNDSTSARIIKARATSTNKIITKSFSKSFDFCPVYFFKMSDSRHVRNQDFDSLTFYNAELEAVDATLLQSENYLIGAFTSIKQDTSHYYENDRIESSDKTTNTKVYSGGTKNGHDAFIIMNRKFQQIQKPFPYFAALQILAPEKTRFRKAIIAMNSKLHAYSGSVGTKEE